MPGMDQVQSISGTDDRQAFEEALLAACSAIRLSLTEPQRELMLAHYRRVVEANRHFNLTRITSPADAAVKHYVDSLTLMASPWVEADRSLTVVDVGTGAGFPAVPLAIMCPQWQILAIDGTGKKARFVAVPTTSGTGSDVTWAIVLTDTVKHRKNLPPIVAPN